MSPRIGFFTRILDDASPAVRYAGAVEQIRLAEDLGLHSAWVAQHHFHRDEGGLPAPLVFLSHVAARTSRIRLGTGIITLPLEDAVRVAEDTAVLDVLTGGRLEVGVGSGGTPSSFAGFGLDPADRRTVFAERLATLVAAWSGEELGPGNRLYPAAPQLLGRLWQATFSADGAARAGARGDGLMLSRTQPRPADRPDATLGEVQDPVVDAYLSALPAGAAPRILASRTLVVGEDRDRVRRFAETGLRRAAAAFRRQGHHLPDDDVDSLIRGTDSYVGTPAEVIASLQADSVLDRATDITFQVHSIDPPHADVLRSLELLATEVAPALGWSLDRTSPAAALARA
ncbi:putative FMN-dependent luciferase-like monooxygenase [Georgenia sp. TF02-10]|uniref:putative FMN-dependent luciferase-like monooxygenase n=1 Tax=Georgenia sp. TF02-10 TaxID=2917725 RepID=UPI001FA7958F|nr:putative FMN-dependent luciferase-like monooxygenase [Georgenia sp. TF02-10]UNX53811.1 putative FMN-dependent luciferase-like monooxygenase [Georgenia sp. TF02-10]